MGYMTDSLRERMKIALGAERAVLDLQERMEDAGLWLPEMESVFNKYFNEVSEEFDRASKRLDVLRKKGVL